MPKRHGNLMPQIADLDNLKLAFAKARRGHLHTRGFLNFNESALYNLQILSDELQAGTYQMGEYYHFQVRDPKPRTISALGFRDRVVQHAIHNIIYPIFDATFEPYCYACRNGRGTHAAVDYIQQQIRSKHPKYFLQTDFAGYFYNIDHEVLHEFIRRKIKCRDTLRLLDQIVSPTGTGIPIGSLTSQLFANLYASELDHLLQLEIKPIAWARYMDDILILGNDKILLRHTKDYIETYARDRLKLRISHWQMNKTSNGVDFLGYRLWPTHRLLRKRSVIRAKRKIQFLVKTNQNDKLARFWPSWCGHARHANTYNLFRSLSTQHLINHKYIYVFDPSLSLQTAISSCL